MAEHALASVAAPAPGPAFPTDSMAPPSSAAPVAAVAQAGSSQEAAPARNSRGKQHSARRRQWSAAQKRTIVQYAIEHGASAAADAFGAHKVNIRRWVRTYRRVTGDTAKDVAAGCGRHIGALPLSTFQSRRAAKCGRRLPEGEESIIADHVGCLRHHKSSVSVKRVKTIARIHARQIGADYGWFTASDAWARGFNARWSIRRHRAAAGAGQEDTGAAQVVRDAYLARLARIMDEQGISLGRVFHAGDISIRAQPNGAYTVDGAGVSAGPGVGTAAEAQAEAGAVGEGAAVVLGGDATGSLFPPFFLCGGPRTRRALTEAADPPQSTVLARSDGRWMSQDAAVQWVDEVLLPAARAAWHREALPEHSPVLLTWKLFSSCWRPAATEWITTAYPWIKVVPVPAHCAAPLLAGDPSPVAAFARSLHHLRFQWMGQHALPAVRPDQPVQDDATAAALRDAACVSGMGGLFLRWVDEAGGAVQASGAVRGGLRAAGILGLGDAAEFNRRLQHARNLEQQGALWQDHSAAATLPLEPQPQPQPQPVEGTGVAPRKRPRGAHRCSICRQSGHNARSCPAGQDHMISAGE